MTIVPYKAFAPVDHKPWGTLALIAANLLVALLLGFPHRVEAPWGFETPPQPAINSWVLELGKVRPLTWVSSAFVHFGWIHLLGNIAFLWTYGLMVEGLIGWRRFVPLYLGIAILPSALVQLISLGPAGLWAGGASVAITGIMAVALLWTPRNRIRFFYWVFAAAGTAEVPLIALTGVFLGFDALIVLFSGAVTSAALFHTMGAFCGLGAGVFMLRRNLVDTGGWDLLSLRASRGHAPGWQAGMGGNPEPRSPREALVDVRDALEARDYAQADDAYDGLRSLAPKFVLPRAELRELVQGLLQRGMREKAWRRGEEFLGAYPEEAAGMRLALVRSLLKGGRPQRAQDLLARLTDSGPLPPAQEAAARELAIEIEQAIRRPHAELE